MLSISLPMRGASAAKYYVDYYTNKMEGQWFGSGARAIGLDGKVTPEHFGRLLEGFSLDGQTALVQNAGYANRQCGWDLTFSAPKSVSVFWSQALEPIRAAVEKAQQAAVKEALHFLEKTAGVTRRGKAGVIHEKAGLAFAAFPDFTSRALDPQLHTHVVIVNVGLRADGTSGTIHSREIFENKMMAGSVYRVALNAELAKELGLQTVPDRFGFRLEGVPEKLCWELSKRRQQIEAELQRRGLDTAVAAKAAAVATRAPAIKAQLPVLFEQWQKVGTQHGWSTKEAEALIGARTRQPQTTVDFSKKIERLVVDEPNAEKGKFGRVFKQAERHAMEQGVGGRTFWNTLVTFGAKFLEVKWRVLLEQGGPTVDRQGVVHRPKVLLKIPRLALRTHHQTWGRIERRLLAGVDGELRIQRKRLFPKAPSFNPASKLELSAIRWYQYDATERLEAKIRWREAQRARQEEKSKSQGQSAGRSQ